MESLQHEPVSFADSLRRAAHVLPALTILWKAHCASEEADRETGDFAVNRAALDEAGICDRELSLLLCGEIVARVGSNTPAGDRLDLSESRRFILTSHGVRLVESIIGAVADAGVGAPTLSASKSPAATPRWDSSRRVLDFQGVVMKKFLRPAPNQECILAAFEEQGWPLRIGDPLPDESEVAAAARLHDAVKRLNRSMHVRIVRFSGDGTGEGVCWRGA